VKKKRGGGETGKSSFARGTRGEGPFPRGPAGGEGGARHPLAMGRTRGKKEGTNRTVWLGDENNETSEALTNHKDRKKWFRSGVEPHNRKKFGKGKEGREKGRAQMNGRPR